MGASFDKLCPRAVDTILIWLHWLQYICFLKYSVDLLFIVEFGADYPNLGFLSRID